MGVKFALGMTGDECLARQFANLIAQGGDVLDIGANRGQLSLLFSKLVRPGFRVIAVEPVPDLVADLRENCRLNRMTNVEAICAAASSGRGELSFVYSPEAATQGKVVGTEPSYVPHSAPALAVAAIPVDDIVVDYRLRPAFVKIDVEGAAGLVIEGAASTLQKYRPAIYLELHGPEEGAAAEVLRRDYKYVLQECDGRPLGPITGPAGGAVFCMPQEPSTT